VACIFAGLIYIDLIMLHTCAEAIFTSKMNGPLRGALIYLSNGRMQIRRSKKTHYGFELRLLLVLVLAGFGPLEQLFSEVQSSLGKIRKRKYSLWLMDCSRGFLERHGGCEGMNHAV
jgi:hypothetical protein